MGKRERNLVHEKMKQERWKKNKVQLHVVGERYRALRTLCCIAYQRRKIVFYFTTLYFFEKTVESGYDVTFVYVIMAGPIMPKCIVFAT